jgi:PTS system nitrogen regulatory IIA component
MAMKLSLPHGETKNSLRTPQPITLPDRAASGPHRKLPAAKDVRGAAGTGMMLREEDIVLGMAAKGKRSALAKISDRLGQRADRRGSTVLSALLRRERLGSTGIGHGVAVPHARLDGIAEPVAMLAVLENPVRFGAPDDQPVDILLTFLWPKDDVAGFLPTLASICRLLRQPDLRARLRAADAAVEARAWMERYEAGEAGQPPWPSIAGTPGYHPTDRAGRILHPKTYFVPVEPKPPAPRAVSEERFRSSAIACATGAMTICATRMPRTISKSSSP